MMANSYREAQRLRIPLSEELIDWFDRQEQRGVDTLTEWDLWMMPRTYNRGYLDDPDNPIYGVIIEIREDLKFVNQQIGEQERGGNHSTL